MKFDQWVEIGESLKAVQRGISKELCAGKYLKSSKEMRWLWAADKFVTKLKDKLDNLLFEEFQEVEFEEKVSVFYGPTKAERA